MGLTPRHDAVDQTNALTSGFAQKRPSRRLGPGPVQPAYRDSLSLSPLALASKGLVS
jgi:hypothetical protein